MKHLLTKGNYLSDKEKLELPANNQRGGARAHELLMLYVFARTLPMRTLQKELHIYNKALFLTSPSLNFFFPLYKDPSIVACRPEWARDLPRLHALGCNPFFFLKKPFLVTKHLVDVIFQLTFVIKTKH